LPDRQQIISNSFGVVLFTLLVQGLTTKFLLDRLNLLNDEQLNQRYLKLVAQRDALQKMMNYLQDSDRKPIIAADQFQQELEFVKTQLEQTKQDLNALRTDHPSLEALVLQQHREKLLAIESSTFTQFVQEGLLKEMPTSVIEQAFVD
jgi:CPA1 family monovalent cation:H+ antiporter